MFHHNLIHDVKIQINVFHKTFQLKQKLPLQKFNLNDLVTLFSPVKCIFLNDDDL